MGTRKTTKGTRTNLTTPMAYLGSVVRSDFNDYYTSSFRFVLDKTLQLKETPVTNPIVHSFSSVNLSYPFEIFHYNLVSIEIGNNVLTDVMINPRHPTVFSSRELFEKPLAGTSAFSLENRTQISELSFDLLDFGSIIKPIVRTDSKVIHSEVNAQNRSLRTTVKLNGIDLFGETENKKTSAFPVNPQKAFSWWPPSEVFFVTLRDSEWNFNSPFDSSQTQDIVFGGSGTREVVSHRTSVNYGFAFGFFNHSTCLFDTSNSQLTLQPLLFDRFINQRMQLDVIPYPEFPSFVNTELQGFAVNFDGFDYFGIGLDFNFSTSNRTHRNNKLFGVYKDYERICPIELRGLA